MLRRTLTLRVLLRILMTHMCACSAIMWFPLSISLNRDMSVTKTLPAWRSNSLCSTSAMSEMVLQASLVIVDLKSNSCDASASATLLRNVYIYGNARSSCVTKQDYKPWMHFSLLLQSFFLFINISVITFASFSRSLALFMCFTGAIGFKST